GAALRELSLEPAPPLAFVVSGTAPGARDETACPECGFRVHAAFVTCPRCALPLRVAGTGEVDAASGSDVSADARGIAAPAEGREGPPPRASSPPAGAGSPDRSTEAAARPASADADGPQPTSGDDPTASASSADTV